MKEIINIIRAYDDLSNTSVKVALATVIDVKGSSYRRTGARMLIQDNGTYTGGISGGCIEGNALKKAYLAITGKKALEVTYDTENDDESQIGVSLGCNGIITVLLAPVDFADQNNPVEELRKCIDNRADNILITILKAKENLIIKPGEAFKYTSAEAMEILLGEGYESSMEDDLKQVIKAEKSAIIDYAACRLFIEFIPPATQIVIMGGNYDVYPLLKVVDNMGWLSVVVANPQRLAREIHQLATSVMPKFEDVVIDKYTVGIIMSHDYNADLNNLKKALKSRLAYIGLLGPASRKKDMLAELGVDIDGVQEQLVFGPAGLDIGASQPEEIAISIVSEAISVMRKRPGTSLRNRQGPIYER